MKLNVLLAGLAALSLSLYGCGGGGGGGGGGGAVYYPYKSLYGDRVCSEPKPSCSFHENGVRVKASEDPNSHQLVAIYFDEYGIGQYTQNGITYYISASSLVNYQGGTRVGIVGSVQGVVDVSSDAFLYNPNNGLLYFGSYDGYWAINEQGSQDASDTSFAALKAEGSKALITQAAKTLVTEYGFEKNKATAIATSLNSWAVSAMERGFTSEKDIAKTFKSVFGVEYVDALAAVKQLSLGEKEAMRDLTNRSAAALGLKPHQAQKFIKGMYKDALTQFGYDESSISW
ncbi:hypothetical protein [Bdellovibrio reynosensis]|uniref:Lipoprotein n=1 Tax=Bdellovibrio reynosensis TaxID=2835041 RepID=A0ABY4CD58_9BACT|nr:hypothetical protein [Bdellovibrio reynosensis]UOF02649.1 hypothetical protein MNR06_06760 [Bdellovibrio reynosensis]